MIMRKDLGTYHFKITAGNGEQFIHRVNTGARYTFGTENDSPADAMRIAPTWDSEEDLIEHVLFAFSADGDLGCDCNMNLFLSRAKQQDYWDSPCGEELTPTHIVLIRPDGSEKVILEGTSARLSAVRLSAMPFFDDIRTNLPNNDYRHSNYRPC